MLYKIVIPLLLLVLPWIVVRYVFATANSRKVSYRQSAPYLLAAAALWFIGCALPEIPMFGGATDTLVLHTIGGIVAVVLFRYVVSAYRLRFALWWQELLFLFALVSTLGVMNELFEFFLSGIGYFPDGGADAWWDLTANTFGASLAFLVVYLVRRIRTSG